MTTKMISLFALCVLLGAVMLACGGAENTNTAANTNTNANTKTTASPAAAASPAATTAASGDKIGVPECDDYIAKVEACLKGKVPEASKGALQTALDTNRKAWRDAAANPQTKAALAQGCKTATETAKTAWKAYGCDF